MVMPSCASGINDMFPIMKWDYNQYVQDCKNNYGVTPRSDWIELNYGGKNLKSTSNIVFTNGLLDPWHPGGVLHNVSDSVIAVLMWGAAHHLDLRHQELDDPVSVIKCRETEVAHIAKWLALKYEANHRIFK